ncbi:MAG TPA: FkbM family methyltransferase [Chthoniobacter sp.]|jgi:FkbM family methyltransferase
MGEFNITVKGGCRPCAMRLQLDPAYPPEKFIIEHLAAGSFCEPDIAEIFLRVLREGDTVVDVGANVGFFTVLAAALVGPGGRVVSFEPDPSNFARLQANVQANGFTHVTLINRPVSDHAGPVSFFLNSDDSGGSALWDPAQYPGNVLTQANPRVLSLESTTLDAELERLALPSVRLLKVDTEGAEHQVVRGARRLLANRGIPFVVAELHPFGLEKLGTNQRALRDDMASAGYDTFLLYQKGTLPRFIPPATTIQSQFFCNILFTTAEGVGTHWPTCLHDPRTA